MFKRLSSSLVLVSGLLFALPLFAGSGHSHPKGPNGGDVKEFGSKHHIEATREGAKVSIYLLDGEGTGSASIAKHSGGTVTVIAPGKSQEKTEIKADGPFSNSSVSVPASGKVTVLVVLKVNGKGMSAKFSFKE